MYLITTINIPFGMPMECFKGVVTIYGEGGATKREGGHMMFYPYEKGGRKKF